MRSNTVEKLSAEPSRLHATSTTSAYHQHIQAEYWLLVLASPLLIFPTVTYIGTTVAIVLLVGFWLWQKAVKQTPVVPAMPFRFALQALMCTIAIGVLVSVDYDLTYRKAVGVLLGFAWLRAAVRTAHLPHGARYLWGAFTAFAVAIVGFGVLTASWPLKVPALHPLISLLPQSNFLLPDSPSDGAHINQLAGALTLIVPMVGGWLFATKTVLRRTQIAIGALLFILLLTIVVLTQSRTAYFAISASLLLGVVLWRLIGASFRVTLACLGLTALGGCVSIRYFLSLLSDTTPTFIGTFDTLAFRQEIWYWAVEAIYDFPYTGTGFGTFRRVVQRLYPVTIDLGYNGTHAHNIFLQVAVDTGVIGLISYCGLLLVTLRTAWHITIDSPAHRTLALGCLCGIVGLHLFGLTDALVLGSKPGILFWLQLGIIGHLNLAAHNR